VPGPGLIDLLSHKPLNLSSLPQYFRLAGYSIYNLANELFTIGLYVPTGGNLGILVTYVLCFLIQSEGFIRLGFI